SRVVGVNPVSFEQKRRNNAEVPPTPANRPEQIFVTPFAGGDEASIGQHEVGGHEVIDGESAFSSQVTHAPAQSQAANTCCRNDSCGYREVEGVCGMIDISPGISSSNPHSSRFRIDVGIANER